MAPQRGTWRFSRPACRSGSVALPRQQPHHHLEHLAQHHPTGIPCEGAQLRPGRAPFLPILTQTVCAARANGLAVIDGVCNEFRELAPFRAECEQGLEFGFDGKSLIHPDQVEPCNAVFSPSEADLAWARAVVAAFELPENQGKGAIRVEGRMAELLHLDQARRLLAIAAAIG